MSNFSNIYIMSDILITLVLATGLAGAYYLYKMLRRPPGFPPGPPALPIIGSLPYLGRSDDQHEFFHTMQELAKKHGPVFSIALNHKYVFTRLQCTHLNNYS